MINKVIWIDKSAYKEENQGYKKIMENELHLKVKEYNDARLGIEAIINEETYSPIFIITNGSIYPEFYGFFKSVVIYIKIYQFKLFLQVVLHHLKININMMKLGNK